MSNPYDEHAEHKQFIRRETTGTPSITGEVEHRYVCDLCGWVWEGSSTSGPAPVNPINIGDPFPLDGDFVGDCEGVHWLAGTPAFCVLDAGHLGPHVASDGEQAVEVWRD